MAAPMKHNKISDVWMESHPQFQKMMSQGVNKEDLRHAMLVYLDLLQDKNWWYVSIKACSETGRVLVSGCRSQSSDQQVAYPVSIQHPISVERLQSCMQVTRNSGLTLPLVDTDSTTAYYKFTPGIIPPETQAMVDFKKRQRQRKFQRRKSRKEALKERIYSLKKHEKIS